MRTNQNATTLHCPVFTQEGAPSTRVPPYQTLKRLTMACMLWEDSFYVDGKKHIEIIEDVCKHVKAEKITELARDCHKKGLLRHMPLFLIVQALKQKAKCSETIYNICNRPDQMTELLSLYWKDGKKSLPAQLKKGLAKAFTRFDEYQLAKYNRDTVIKLRDVLFLCHAKPKDKEQEVLWKKLIDKTLKTPDTWETRLSGGNDKKESFQELLEASKMGKLAIVRNLRNMQESGVCKKLVKRELMRNGRPLLPFQFLAAAKACPSWEDIIDEAMIKACESKKQLDGTTIVLVDVSGSMASKVSGKSEISNMDAANAIAILLREICEHVEIFSFSNSLILVPARRGMALRDAILKSQPNQGTYLGQCLRLLLTHRKPNVDITRVIVITDEQTHDVPPKMNIDKCYIINTACYQNGIKNNGEWLTINGFSEYVIDYILEIEQENDCKSGTCDESIIQESDNESCCMQKDEESSKSED